MILDLVRACRWLRHNPLFALAVTAILALGIGANTAVFSIVDAVLLRPLPYDVADRLVRVDETTTKWPISGFPYEGYLRWKDRTDLFERTVPFAKDFVTLTGGAQPDQVVSVRTGGGLFALLGVQARLGRTLLDSDDNPASPKVVVLGDRLWRRLFHADPGVIGRAVRIGDEAYTVAGVMPHDFAFPYSNIELWMPLHKTGGLLQVVASLKRGVPLTQVQSAMAIVARQMESEDPSNRPGLRIEVQPWSEGSDVKYERTLVLILAAVGLVLMIACADVGGLLLSRAVQRQKEIAIRASLGAGLWRVARQLLAESFVLAVLGSAAGIAVAYYALQVLARQLAELPVVLPHLHRVELNGRVLLFNTVLCLVLAGLCSLAPVLSAMKTDLQAVLRSGTGRPKHSTKLFSMLIGCEAAFAFLLLVGSGLMIRSLVKLYQEDHGFRPDHVLTLRVPVGTRTERPSGKFQARPQQMAYYKEMLERLERVPGVRSVAVVNNLPMSGVNGTTVLNGPDGKPMGVSTRTISPQYFAALGTPLLAGRLFNEQDHGTAPYVAIINEYLAKQLFPNRDPLGQRITTPEKGPGATVVGVVRDSPQVSYDQPAKGEIYHHYQQFIFAIFMSTFVVRTDGDPMALADVLRKEVWAVNANQPVVKVQAMNEVIASSIWRPRFSAWIFTVLGLLSLVLTCIGVYSVVAYTTALRAREVGIRVALGATPESVVSMILRGVMVPLVLGLAVSAMAAVFLARVMGSVLYEVSGSDPVTYVGAGLVLLATGVVASLRPAWRAATGDAVVALRTE
jgi:predicted permease